MDSFASPCDHSQHHGLESCPGLSEAELAFGEKVRSVALNFVQCGGKDDWHGPTVSERVNEHFENAARYGNAPPEYAGRAVLR